MFAARSINNIKCKAEDRINRRIALATGLTTMISDDGSVFLTFMMNEILEIVDIGNKILQSRGNQNGLCSSCRVKSNVKALKTDYPDETSVIDAVNESMDKLQSERVGGKRLSSVPSKLIEDFVVTERLPSASSNRRRPREFKPLFVQMVDLLWSELNERFDDKNMSLRESMESLRPSSKTFPRPVSLEKLFVDIKVTSS